MRVGGGGGSQGRPQRYQREVSGKNGGIQEGRQAGKSHKDGVHCKGRGMQRVLGHHTDTALGLSMRFQCVLLLSWVVLPPRLPRLWRTPAGRLRQQ